MEIPLLTSWRRMWFAQNEFAQGVLPQLYVTRWGGGGCWHSITYIHTHKIAVSIETWLHSRATPGPLLVEFEWMLSFITCNHWGETWESVHSSPIKWFYSYYSRLLSTLCNTLHSFPSPGLYLHSPAGGNKSYKALILIRLFFSPWVRTHSSTSCALILLLWQTNAIMCVFEWLHIYHALP